VGDLVEVFADGAGAPDEEGGPGKEEERKKEPVGDGDDPQIGIYTKDLWSVFEWELVFRQIETKFPSGLCGCCKNDSFGVMTETEVELRANPTQVIYLVDGLDPGGDDEDEVVGGERRESMANGDVATCGRTALAEK
jgi:hypothetical protein